MALAAYVIAALAAAGMIATWLFGAVLFARALRGAGGTGDAGGALRALWIAFWPFASGRVRDREGAPARNKAFVALLAFALAAASAGAVATNLHRMLK